MAIVCIHVVTIGLFPSVSPVRFHGYSVYTCSYYRSMFLVCNHRFHGYSMYTCSYYRSLFLVCHQLGSIAIVYIQVVTIGLCS